MYFTDSMIERRCRYRLSMHGLRMHKRKTNDGESYYYLYEHGQDDSPPEEDDRYFTLKRLIDYCEDLAEKDSEYYAMQRENRR